MKNILVLGAMTLCIATSCVSNLNDDFNVDPKKATEVPPATLLANAEFNLSNIITTPDYNYNPFRYYLQYWAAVQYPEESQYNINTREINRSFWTVIYRDVLSDLREAKRVIDADPLMVAADRASQLAMIDIVEVYAWSVLVNTFGNIPYGQALDINNVQAVYEDDAAIYADLVKRLNAAISALEENENASTFGENELLYKGDAEQWLKFGNSLKLKLGITLADVDPANAKKIVEEAADNVFTSKDDEARLNYTGNTPTASPVYDVLRQRNDNVGASTFIELLTSLADPRLNEYFRPAASGPNAGKFVGGIYGDYNVYASFAQPSSLIRQPQLPGLLLSYTEVEFLLAEARLRGYNAGGTAQEHYNAAVTNSIVEDWNGTAAEAAAYLARPGAALDVNNWKKSIGIQKWIALYNQPVEEWKEWRRLDFPQLQKPKEAQSEMPVRWTYPITERNLNAANYQSAAAAMGGDEVTSKIFWDKF